MEIKTVCQDIYDSVIKSAEKIQAPVAYITLNISKDFPFTNEQIIQEFDKFKWNTGLSTADLIVEIDASLESNSYKVIEIQQFKDDE